MCYQELIGYLNKECWSRACSGWFKVGEKLSSVVGEEEIIKYKGKTLYDVVDNIYGVERHMSILGIDFIKNRDTIYDDVLLIDNGVIHRILTGPQACKLVDGLFSLEKELNIKL